MKRILHHIFTLGFLFSWSVALTAYVNSSFIETTLGPGTVGLLFVIGAIVTIIFLELMPKIVETIGNETAFLFALAMCLLGITLLLCGGPISALGFVLYLSANTAVFFTIDIFLRHFAKKETTGTLRGVFLTLTNLAWVLSPFLAGVIVEKYGFSTIYLLAFCVVSLVAISSLFALKHFRDAKYYKVSIVRSIISSFKRPDLRDILGAQFLLQLFYSVMVVFSPLYLMEVHGFHFREIGIMFTIMLLPFVLFQYPLGKLADKKLGEKELLIAGFLILSVATIVFAFYAGHTFFAFALILFCTRIGASIVEIMTETYFFKQISVEEPELVSTFRGMAPLAHLVGPLLAGIAIPLFGFTPVFAVLGVVLLVGVRLAYLIHDTK